MYWDLIGAAKFPPAFPQLFSSCSLPSLQKEMLMHHPIPENIYREHIFQAMLRMRNENMDQSNALKGPAILYEGHYYNCKLIIAWANLYANGEKLDTHPRTFTTYDAQAYLDEKKFQIVPHLH